MRTRSGAVRPAISTRSSAFPAGPRWFIATIWCLAANEGPTAIMPRHPTSHRPGYCPHKEEPRLLNAAGVRRRVIEGEGLGGFARRLTVNGTGEGLFRPR